MAQQNSINNKSSTLTMDPLVSADSAIQLSVDASAKFIIGVDQSDSNSFVVSGGSALGTTNTFKIVTAGSVTKPLQSAFGAYKSANTANYLGNSGTAKDITCNTELFDQNSDYNNATYTFTAPVTGRYAFYVLCGLYNVGTLHQSGIQLLSSNRLWVSEVLSIGAIRDSGASFTFPFSIITDMDAADTMIPKIAIYNSTLTVGMAGGTSPMQTVFSGYLAC